MSDESMNASSTNPCDHGGDPCDWHTRRFSSNDTHRVPALHDELYTGLSSFRTSVAQSWDGSRAPVAFSANLLAAHSARGPALLSPGLADSVLLEVDNLKALGVGAVTLHIDFPMLHRPFHRSDEEYQQYLAFYVRLAQEIRARELTLVVASQTLFSKDALTPWDLESYYDGLTLEEYRQGRMEVARTIASALRPDYLSVIVEPDTEADQSNKPELGTVEGSRALLDVILGGLQADGVEGVAVGAGVGTWQDNYRSFVESFASTAIDFIDVHVYPVTGDYLPRALEIADVAASYGKRVGMSETWLYKVSAQERDLALPEIFARDAFSFWASLDGLHLQTMVELAHFKRFAFMSPFWSGYLRGYVNFDAATRDLTWPELNSIAQATWSANLLAGVYSTSGGIYRNALLVPGDVTPPAAPGQLVAQLASPTSVAVTWRRSDDDVGTAAYGVLRDGVLVAQTAMPYFVEPDLAEARPYVYSVVAFDASGNVSAPASAVVRTPDITPPSVPQGFTAIATRTGNQITVVFFWAPSSDNVGVTQYRLTRGTSPNGLSVIAGPMTNSYTLVNVKPDTTFYFGISSIDTSGNLSSESVVSVTTPSLPDATPPVVTMVYPSDGATVSRKLYLYALTYDVMSGTYDLPSGPAAVRFFIDGVPVGDERTVPYTSTPQYSVFSLETATLPLSAGEHLLTAMARDLAGNVAMSAPIRVIVRP